ncbi:MAG: hypothetical protein QXJ07_04055 [Candidatus Bathyarchaeia archaeon]
MQKGILLLDTGVILPFCSIRFPTSKKKVIDFMIEKFEIFIPDDIEVEMQKPKAMLIDKWEEISLTWTYIRSKVKKMNPPEDCVNTILKECKIKNKAKAPAELKVLALGLYLSRFYKSPVFLSTHEKDAFKWFAFVSRKQQLGYVLSPYDILTFVHVYLNLPYNDVNYAWGELCQFPGISSTLLLIPISYASSLDVCYQYCNTKSCVHQHVIV